MSTRWQMVPHVGEWWEKCKEERARACAGDTAKQVDHVHTEQFVRANPDAVFFFDAASGSAQWRRPAGFYDALPSNERRPIDWITVANTTWMRVTTNDGFVYYHDSSTKQSVWQMPEALHGLVLSEYDWFLSAWPSTHASSVPSARKRPREQDTDAGAESSSTSSGGKRQRVQDDDSSDDSSDDDSDDEHNAAVFAERVKLFESLLSDTGVNQFSKWDAHLPKLVFDARFKALPKQKQRQLVFREYVARLAADSDVQPTSTSSTEAQSSSTSVSPPMPQAELFKRRRAQQLALMQRIMEDARKRGWLDTDPSKLTLARLRRKVERHRSLQALWDELRDSEPGSKDDKSKAVAVAFAQQLKVEVDVWREEKRNFVALVHSRSRSWPRHPRWSDVKHTLADDPRYKAVRSGDTRRDWFYEALDQKK